MPAPLPASGASSPWRTHASTRKTGNLACPRMIPVTCTMEGMVNKKWMEPVRAFVASPPMPDRRDHTTAFRQPSPNSPQGFAFITPTLWRHGSGHVAAPHAGPGLRGLRKRGSGDGQHTWRTGNFRKPQTPCRGDRPDKPGLPHLPADPEKFHTSPAHFRHKNPTSPASGRSRENHDKEIRALAPGHIPGRMRHTDVIQCKQQKHQYNGRQPGRHIFIV